ncbi:MAG: ABC transporter permease [Opitutus sp.]|nr:ABC transporter permease [Opitutus sp.]MCS6245900.1 ABC transporter permease [Opitutus sp.]MCS6272962.1 ABC transporter permease [Opitutus sp.]MCS6276021.1 ABC transporter permease [Opitutus sp.]MCS6301116.1 ABC transporter permease [Opitutus sp.]
MRLVATTIIALRALRRNKMRSVLTALGMIIGVGAVIAMVSIGNGAKAQVEASIASLGQNIISVYPGTLTTGGARGGSGTASTLTPEDALAIQQDIAGVVAVSPEVRDRQQILANGLNWNTSINGESPDFLSIRDWGLAEGVIFTDLEVRSTAKVAVIGQTVADQLFPGSSPIGQTLRIRNIPFKIIGLLKPKGFNYFGSDQDDTVLIPYTSAMRRVSRRTNLSSILIQAATQDQMPRIQQEITDLLQQRRQGREPDFTVRNQMELAQAATATSRTMTGLLGAIAGVSLIVGGIGIMNIMLVSVTERTREIGIRLAIGAHDHDIRLQFLIEAMVLSLMGGALGILIGVGASQIVSQLNGWPVQVSSASIIVAFVFSGAVGIGFGFYPAHKAAKLDPIEALRFE